jgi:hypothetical protein
MVCEIEVLKVAMKFKIGNGSINSNKIMSLKLFYGAS